MTRPRQRHATAACFLAAACATVSPAGAADGRTGEAPAARPRICLALSGGGARGAAHVGILKVLEEYRVPIHCIAGTSMGSLIGGAYASGMDVAEMEQVSAGISTELLFREKPPRPELSMRRKQDDDRNYTGPEVGIADGSLRLPKGIVTGVQLETVLRRLSRVKGYRRFDDLPIPFRAVATDLTTGKAMVFSEGELANVMRASMSVPGAVAPAEFDGMLLVDGGLTSNLPVETARAMGADIVIAVNVGTPLLKRAEITGVLGVTEQMLNILTEQNVRSSLAALQPQDILISPDLHDFSAGDFDHLPKIIPRGNDAARGVADRLRMLSLPPAEYAALRQRQTAAVAPDTRTVDEIRFPNLGSVNPRTLQAMMETRPGEPIDQARLDADLRRLYGTGDFERVNYRLLEEPGRLVLAVDAVEKAWGPDFLRAGLGLSSDFSGDAYFNLLLSHRRTWLNALGAEWRTDLQIGRTSSFWTEFYQPLNAQGSLFVAPRAGIERRWMPLYGGDERIASYQVVNARAALDFGVNFARTGELRLGLLRGEVRPELETGPPSLSPGAPRVEEGAVTAKLVFDQFDSVRFPRSGWRAGAGIFRSATALGADLPYSKWEAEASAAHSLGEHTFHLAFRAGGRSGSDPLPRYDQFQWGGFLQQSGYATGQLLGEKLQFARAMYYRRILRGGLFEGTYGGVSLEFGRMGQPLVPGNPDQLLKSGALFIASDTPVGPAYLGYGRAKDGNSSFYFFLGRPF